MLAGVLLQSGVVHQPLCTCPAARRRRQQSATEPSVVAVEQILEVLWPDPKPITPSPFGGKAALVDPAQ